MPRVQHPFWQLYLPSRMSCAYHHRHRRRSSGGGRTHSVRLTSLLALSPSCIRERIALSCLTNKRPAVRWHAITLSYIAGATMRESLKLEWRLGQPPTPNVGCGLIVHDDVGGVEDSTTRLESRRTVDPCLACLHK